MSHGKSLSNVLYIDLTKKSFWVKKRDDLFHEYIGGTGVATQLLKEECPAGIDAYSPDNPVIFAVGALTGLFPLASKTVAMFKSPLTGNLGESHAGGRSAVSIRMAGYGAIVIKGKSELPIYIAIHGHKVFFKDATSLWDIKSCFVAGRIIRQHEEGSGTRAIMRIGRGGERLVSYGAVTTETFRHFGRLGLGAVFGSKNLKALVVSGEASIPIENKPAYRKLYDQIYKTATESPVMKKYHDLGTAGNIKNLNAIGALPTKNLSKGTFEHAEKICGEALASNYLGRRLACAHCPVGCIHIAALREPYENEAYFYKTTMIGYDFELIYALGSSLGIDEPEGMLKLIDVVEKYCIDTMSTGVVLAWATEAFEKGIITEKETDGVIFKWGDHKSYIKAVDKIIDQPNDFYKALARGAAYASKIYGGKDFAMAFGGNEMPGYHTGPAAYLNYTLSTRHSHLDAAGYAIDQKMITDKKAFTPEQIVDQLMEEEQWRQVISGLCICFFARGIYTPEIVREALEIAGLSKTAEEITAIGKKIYKEKYNFKMREGFSLDNVELPSRIYETKSPSIVFDKEFIQKGIAYAKKKIGEM